MWLSQGPIASGPIAAGVLVVPSSTTRVSTLTLLGAG